MKFKLLLILSVILAGCGKDDGPKQSQYEKVNAWMYDNMDYWYYWTHILPAEGNQNMFPEDYYYSLLSSEDRFSFIYENYQELIDLLNGVSLESGFEFKLYEEGANGVIMQLQYIKPGSPADLLGFRRGDVIYNINDQTMTKDNYRDLLGAMNATYQARYRRYNAETQMFEDLGTLQVVPVVFSENPVLMDTIYQMAGKKIAYLIYNFFSPGASENSFEFDELLESTFQGFKNESINELIVDLRFNTGGSEYSIVTLASLMVQGASSFDLLMRKNFNSKVEADIIAHPSLGPGFLTVEFEELAGNVGSMLESGKVHFIVSDRSASASEVVINALKPYMDVFLVGETTYGKDAGSITLYDEDSKSNLWGLQPIVLKLVNADGEDYPDGFAPDVFIEDRFDVLTPLGDINEPLLNTTLAAVGVVAARTDFERRENALMYQSIESKKWTNKVLIDAQELQIEMNQ